MSTEDSEPGRFPGTRFVHLAAGQDRARADDTRTVCQPEAAPAGSFRDLFVHHFGRVRAVAACREAGVGTIVFDATGRLVATAWLAGRPGAVGAAVLGRHGCADVYLDGHRELSLRHLSLLVSPLTSWDRDGVRFRVVDLRTGLAFTDERGRRLEAVESDGPAFVRCGGTRVLFLPTGGRLDWPASPAAAWAALPERVFTGERAGEPDRWARRAVSRPPPVAARPRRAPPVTHVTRVEGPLGPDAPLVLDGERPIGELSIETRGRAWVAPVGPHAADRGLLLGRYPRCEGARVLFDPEISRVHLLVVRVDGEMVAVDCASTLGTWVAGRSGDVERARVVDLRREPTLALATGSALVRWRALPGQRVH